MDFVAIDVETANADLSSICQVGVAVFEGGKLTGGFGVYVDPESHFDGANTAVHGIGRATVAGAPTFPEIMGRLREALSGRTAAHHTAFDKLSLTRAARRYDLGEFDCRWLDTARVTRRAWPQFASRGYGLANVAREFGIKFRHHDAQEDARAAGEILVRALGETGLVLEEWHVHLSRAGPASGRWTHLNVTRQGDPDGPFAGEIVVFTGSLSISRQDAADLAARAGCDVAPGVTKKTTLLVVGDQDVRQLAGREKSNKHRKAEELIGKGQAIRILAEGDFVRLVEID